MASAADPRAAEHRAQVQAMENPRPQIVLPAYPGDLKLWEAIVYGKKVAIWNIEEIMRKVKAKEEGADLPTREREARVLAQYERLLGRLVMLETRYEQSQATEKSHDDARAGAIKKARSPSRRAAQALTRSTNSWPRPNRIRWSIWRARSTPNGANSCSPGCRPRSSKCSPATGRRWRGPNSARPKANGAPGCSWADAARARRAPAPNGYAHCVREGRARSIALVGATYDDVRDVMIEGPSGLATLCRGERALFEPSKGRLSWPGGAVAHVFTAEKPHGIRGYEFDAAWCDEFAKWNNAQETMDMLEMALRTGGNPRMVVTTTPRATAAMKALLAKPGLARTHATTRDNAAHLAPAFLAQMEAQYAGTRLGRQELDAELIEDNDRALWKREWIERRRVVGMPDGIYRIVIGVDPPAGTGEGADECGIVIAGKDNDRQRLGDRRPFGARV